MQLIYEEFVRIAVYSAILSVHVLKRKYLQMKKIIQFVKSEVVLTVALFLAVVSMLFVHPDAAYVEYIDFRTLSILFCLMAVMAGFQEVGVFRMIAEKLLKKVSGVFGLVYLLVMLCFFFSMLITNDVALITFIPFTFIVLQLLGEAQEKRLIIPVVVMQTIAANLGSMLTPIGNPQNLYLYGKSGYSFGEFILLMLPYAVIAFILLTVYCVLLGKKSIGNDAAEECTVKIGATKAGAVKECDAKKSNTINVSFSTEISLAGKEKAILRYAALFIISLLVVVRVVPYPVALAILVLVLVVFDRPLFGRIDYALLLTFVGFFVFIGNMGRVPVFNQFLAHIIEDNEVVTAVVSSQVISNVPAALLLSGFTENIRDLIIGTNLGGLGTLIASMASLISYKFMAKSDKCSKGSYFIKFTLWNVVFLVILMGAWMLIG